MAQDGDTITYTYNGGTSSDEVRQSEDITSIDKITVDYLHGAGGDDGANSGGSGGSVENAVFDVSGFDTLYIWVATQIYGRYNGSAPTTGGGGSTEISLFKTDRIDSSDEPFLAGAGGGGGSGIDQFIFENGGTGGRQNNTPQGGSAGTGGGGGDGFGAIDDQNRGYTLNAGTTTQGGGSGQNEDGEIQITYKGSPNVYKNRGRRARLFR